MGDFIKETKQLKAELQENESKYISGELDLNETLDKTEELFKKAISSNETTASTVIHDTVVLEHQTRILKQRVKCYNVNPLVFKPREFSIKVRNLFCPRLEGEKDEGSKKSVPVYKIWDKLGEKGAETILTVPNFSFLYGSFDAVPIENVKKKRKQVMKDKVGALTKAETVNQNTIADQQDVMIQSAERVLEIFKRLAKKTSSGTLCYYEFVTHPQSFTVTVENIFLVSLLVKEGCLRIFSDSQGLPCLKQVEKNEKGNCATSQMQSVLSLSMQEWEDIVKTFRFKTPVIPPRQAQAKGHS